MHRAVLSIVCLILMSVWAKEIEPDFSTPEATFDTFVKAVCAKDKKLCLLCITEEIRDEISDDWEAEELPDSVVWSVDDKEMFEDAAALKITLWDDMAQEEDTEVLWFVLEDDGWKICMEPPEDIQYERDSTRE